VNERSGVAALLLRAHLTWLELPFEHEIVEEDGGWRLKALGDGRLQARFVNGEVFSADIDAGDEIVGRDGELYVALAEPRVGSRRTRAAAKKPATGRARRR
jgi:hypothetical protein